MSKYLSAEVAVNTSSHYMNAKDNELQHPETLDRCFGNPDGSGWIILW